MQTMNVTGRSLVRYIGDLQGWTAPGVCPGGWPSLGSAGAVEI
jgi:hypothetical protein